MFYNTVVKKVEVRNSTIISLTAIQREPLGNATGYERFYSSDILDWYSPEDSDHFSKKVLTFAGIDGKPAVFIDATEYGELLVLSGSDWY